MLDACNRVSKLYVETEGFHILELLNVRGFQYSCGPFLIMNMEGSIYIHSFHGGLRNYLNYFLRSVVCNFVGFLSDHLELV
jgi:hypothetical protein